MGFSFGGYIIEHAAPVKAPRTWRELSDLDPAGDMPPADPDASLDFLELAYDGTVHRIDETVGMHIASSREGKRPYVTFHDRCVVVFDLWGALSSNFERPEPPARFDARLAAYSSRRGIQCVMVFTLDSVSDSYGFIVFQNGERVRRFSFIPTEKEPIRLDEGARLPTEPSEADVHPETRIDAAAKSLLGCRLLELVGSESLRAFVCDKR
jgi:hypothetical protein